MRYVFDDQVHDEERVAADGVDDQPRDAQLADPLRHGEGAVADEVGLEVGEEEQDDETRAEDLKFAFKLKGIRNCVNNS